MKLYLIYDDTLQPTENISNVIGNKSFGDVIVKHEKLSKIYQRQITQNLRFDIKWFEIGLIYEMENIKLNLPKNTELNDFKIIHCFSNCIINNPCEVTNAILKIGYINENIFLTVDNKIAAIMFFNISDYIKFIEKSLYAKSTLDAAKEFNYSKINVNGYTFIGDTFNFIKCITGNFDSRYFNSIIPDNYTLTKTSSNKNKIKAEYKYY